MTTLSLQDVAVQLHHMAQAARSDAMITGDYGVVKLMSDRAKLFARMAETCILAIQAGDTVTLPPVKARRAPASKRMGAEVFWRHYSAAVARVMAVHGDRWRVVAPMGETQLARLPSSLASYKNQDGNTVRYRRDQRMPAAHYWDVALPAEIELIEDYARETRDREWGDMREGMSTTGYQAWLDRWATREGLTRSKGRFYRVMEAA